MQKVFVVFYDSVYITKNCGVFASTNLASKFIEKDIVENGYDREYYTIERWELQDDANV
jgi:hypothetical protein